MQPAPATPVRQRGWLVRLHVGAWAWGQAQPYRWLGVTAAVVFCLVVDAGLVFAAIILLPVVLLVAVLAVLLLFLPVTWLFIGGWFAVRSAVRAGVRSALREQSPNQSSGSAGATQ